MKKLFLTVVLLGVVAIFVAGAWFLVALKSAHEPGPLAESRIVLIERGKGVAAIAEILKSEGVIDSSLIFKVLSRIETDQRPLKAGEYEFTANVTMAEAMKMMREGKVYDRKVTFPEGVTSWQIVETLKGLPDMTGEIADTPAEGSLLPQTYHYIKNDDRNVLLGKMKEDMDKTVAELWPARAPDP